VAERAKKIIGTGTHNAEPARLRSCNQLFFSGYFGGQKRTITFSGYSTPSG
jgi:hypothetical protein